MNVTGWPRVITVWQPWAYALIYLGKDVENRPWSTAYRGPLLIHSGRRVDPAGTERLRAAGAELPDEAYRTGHIVGMAELTGCVRDSPSPWATPGSVHWLLSSARAATSLVCVRGRRGLLPAEPGWEAAFGEPGRTRTSG